MKNKMLYQYARQLSRHIDDRRARAETAEEIYSHLCEMVEGYVAQGMTEQEAQIQAVNDMESPDDLGVQMDKVHTPKVKWWFYCLIIILLLTIIIGVFTWINAYADKAGEQNIMPDKETVLYEE